MSQTKIPTIDLDDPHIKDLTVEELMLTLMELEPALKLVLALRDAQHNEEKWEMLAKGRQRIIEQLAKERDEAIEKLAALRK